MEALAIAAIATGGLQVLQGARAGAAASSIGEANAAQTLQQMETDQAQTDAERRRLLIQRRERQGEILAGTAGSGFQIDQGAPLVVLGDQLAEFDRTLAEMDFFSRRRDVNFRNTAAIQRAGGQAQASGLAAQGLFGGISTGLAGADRLNRLRAASAPTGGG